MSLSKTFFLNECNLTGVFWVDCYDITIYFLKWFISFQTIFTIENRIDWIVICERIWYWFEHLDIKLVFFLVLYFKRIRMLMCGNILYSINIDREGYFIHLVLLLLRVLKAILLNCKSNPPKR